MADYKGLTVKLGADDSSLSAALRNARNSAKGVTTELRSLNKALKVDPSNTKLLAQQQEDYRAKIKQTEKELEALRAAEEQIGKDGMSSDQWVKLQSDIAMAENRLKSYKRELTDSIIQQDLANSKMNQFGENLLNAGTKLGNVASKLTSMGSTLTRNVSLPLVAVGAATVAAATEIDTSLTNVKKTVDGTAEQYQQLKDAAIEFSKTNAVSATEILDIQSLGAQLGFTIEELDEFSRVVSGLDIATNMDADTAATELAQFANITKMSHEEISNYGSAIVGLGNNFATTEADISAMAMRLAASGTQVGMSQADILGLATALSSLGVEAEAGGTAVSTVMANIDKAVATNDASLSTWAQTAGMSAEQFAAAWKGNAAEALGAVLSGMEAATAEGGNMSVMLDELGVSSLRQTDVMKRLAGNSELVSEAVARANDEWKSNTALQAEVDNRNDSLAAKFEMVKNRITAVADDIGGPLADALLDAIDAAEPLFTAIENGAKAFSDMSKEDQQLVLGLVALAAAAGPACTIAGKLVGVVGNIATKSGNAVKAIAEFSAACKAAGTMAAQSGDKIGNLGTKLESSLSSGMLTVAIAALVAVLGMAFAAWKQVNDEMQKAEAQSQGIIDATNALADASRGVTPTLKNEADALNDVNEAAKLDFDEAIQQHNDLAEKISDLNTEANTNVSMLSTYQATIEELGEKGQLSEAELAKLKIAVDGINSACGTNYSIVQDSAGAYSIMADGVRVATDEILKLIDAQKLQARAEVASEAYKAAYAQLQTDAQNSADALAALTAAQNDLNNAQQMMGDNAVVYDQFGGVIVDYLEDERQAVAVAQENYDKMKALEGATQSATNQQEEWMTLLTMAQSENANAIVKAAAANDQFRANVQATNTNLVGFTQAIGNMGFSLEQFNAIAADPYATQQLALAWSQGTDSMVATCQQLGITLPEAFTQAMSASAQAITDAGVDINNAQMQVKDGALQIWSDGKGEFVTVTGDMMTAITGQIGDGASAIEGAVSTMADGTVVVWDAASQRFVQVTQSAMDGAVDAVANGASNAQGAAETFVGPILESADKAAEDVPKAADDAGKGFAENLGNAEGATKTAANSLATASQDVGKYRANALTWGGELGSNFASGISSKIGAVSAAANALAAAAANPIKHTAPKEGPLKGGEEIFGKHLAENFAGGIKSGRKKVSKESLALASAVAAYIKHTSPTDGPLKGGEWVFGYHAAVNFAEGLKSGVSLVEDAASELATSASDGLTQAEDEAAKFRAYIDDMVAHYTERSNTVQTIAQTTTDLIWKTAYSIADTYEYTLPKTGAVYDSMRLIEKAGYTLESFQEQRTKNADIIAKYEEKDLQWAEKMADWDDKRAKTNSKGESTWTDQQQRNYERDLRSLAAYEEEKAEAYQKIAEYEQLEQSLTASVADMKQFSAIYEVKRDIIDAADETREFTSAFLDLKARGIPVTEEFIDAFRDGGDSYQEVLLSMRDMTDDECNEIVKSWQDVQLAQEEEELELRSLLVSANKNTNFTNPRKQLIEFRNTVLDVREALDDDSGLAHAFAVAGMSEEEFAGILLNTQTSMEDAQKSIQEFTDSVSNGFQQMTKYNQTTLEDWKDNIRLNMAESAEYAKNLEAVFKQIDLMPELDAEAFRKAVTEGGFSQWGQIMADMAKEGQESIRDVVELYNSAIVEGQQSAISQMETLNPGKSLLETLQEYEGEFYMTAQAFVEEMVDAFDDKTPDVESAATSTTHEGAMAALSLTPEFYNVGAQCGDGIERGISSRVSSIAASAAAAVRAAIEAAKAEAEIASPSKVMDREVGQMLMAGGTRGIERGSADMVSAMRASMASTLNSVKSGNFSSQAVATNYTTNAPVNITWNTTVRSDSDLRKMQKMLASVTTRSMKGRGQWA